ncbi:MAG: glycosyltransferase family 39 protein [Magnetococcales bacterium]|nr:glycosyltransferase family 39 protein [Magnetococcales bacterium]
MSFNDVMNRRQIGHGVALFLIILLGGWLRWVVVEETVVIDPLRSDALEYFNDAFNTRHHGVYSSVTENRPGHHPAPDAFRTPGYPIFLLPFVDGPPTESMLHRIYRAQAVLGTLTLVAVWLLARHLLPGGLSLAATFLTTICPHLMTMNHYLLSESLFTFLLLWFLVVLQWGTQGGGWWLAGAGCLLGAASLTRPALQFFIIPAILALALLSAPSQRRRNVLWVTVGFLMVFSPWLVRNRMVLGQWSDDRATIATMHHGLYPGFMFQDDPKTFGFPYRFDPRSEEISRSLETVRHEIVDRFTHEPGRYLRWYLLEKPVRLWSWGIVQGQGDAFVYPVADTPFAREGVFRFFHRLMFATHAQWMLLGFVGAVLAWLPVVWRPGTSKENTMARLIALMLFYMTAIHILGAPFPRYNIPLRPLAYIMALYALVIFFRWLRHRLQPNLPGPSPVPLPGSPIIHPSAPPDGAPPGRRPRSLR